MCPSWFPEDPGRISGYAPIGIQAKSCYIVYASLFVSGSGARGSAHLVIGACSSLQVGISTFGKKWIPMQAYLISTIHGLLESSNHSRIVQDIV